MGIKVKFRHNSEKIGGFDNLIPHMKKIFFLIFYSLLISCNVQKTTNEKQKLEQKEIDVITNRTIETFMILRSLSESDPLFKYRKADYDGKPLIYLAREYFKDFKNNIAVQKTQELLDKTSITGDLILQGLLYSAELPQTKLNYELNPYWKKNESDLVIYLNILRDFYVDAKVEDFLQKNEKFYIGAIAEAKSYLNKDLIPTMEDYFGETNPHYKLILIPNSPFGMGFAADVGAGENKILYQIISPASDIASHKNILDYEEFGYSGKDADKYYRDLVAHEFCHSFITPLIKQKKYLKKINETDSLFVPKLKAIMDKQSYGDWWGFVNEHLVRLTSIRISEIMKLKDVDEMRADNVNVKKFVLIPDAEKLIIDYENNRKVYPTFKKFIPKLIEQLQNYTREDIIEKIRIEEKLESKKIK